MKYAECNEKQKKAYKNICHASNFLLGGLENTLEDYDENSSEYISAKKRLDDHEGLVQELYSMATTDVYDDGCVFFGSEAQKFMKDIRFCGKDWLLERCEARIKRSGY